MKYSSVVEEEFFKSLGGDFSSTKSETKTKKSESPGKKKTKEDTKMQGDNLVKLGQLLMNQVPMQQAMAPRVVGNAAQITPQLAAQQQPNLQNLQALSRLLGGA